MNIKTKLSRSLSAIALVVAVSAGPATAESIQPLHPVKEINPALAELGKKLFFDPRLSKSGFISCNSCHNLSMGGTDNLKTSIGHSWQQGLINAPTVLNSSLNLAQFWDGQAADLKAQAKVTAAIAEFEKTLVTLNSRFDKWLLGKQEAYPLQGWRLHHLSQWPGGGGELVPENGRRGALRDHQSGRGA
ncbi:MAG: Cytochrome c551 peroxidase (EC 1.11.1.5) [Olavius algarvensis Gamma 1 endosymbiont]|nr:MAG: Cytochrome c551 peroxidase (EC 1.11.1.5) [Olavius algarvensis Gamma 1 endosymbiont]